MPQCVINICLSPWVIFLVALTMTIACGMHDTIWIVAGLTATYHAKNEYCLLSDMCQGYRVFASIISQLEDWCLLNPWWLSIFMLSLVSCHSHSHIQQIHEINRSVQATFTSWVFFPFVIKYYFPSPYYLAIPKSWCKSDHRLRLQCPLVYALLLN